MNPNILISQISFFYLRFLEQCTPSPPPPQKNVAVVPFPSYYFHLFQYYLDPPIKLNEALERYGLKKDDFFLLRHGESRNLNTNDRFEN